VFPSRRHYRRPEDGPSDGQSATATTDLRPTDRPTDRAPVAVLALNIWGHGPMASALARAYNRGLGQSTQRGPGAEPLVECQGALPTEAEALLVFGLSYEAANLPTFLKIW